MTNLHITAASINRGLAWYRYRLATSLKFHGLWFTILWCLMCAARLSPAPWFIAFRCRHLDRRYGIETTQPVEPSQLGLTQSQSELSIAYEPTEPEVLTGVLAKLPVDLRKYSFVDLGSGKGLALILASMFPFKRIIGVEWSGRVAEVGWSNVTKFHHPKQQCSDIEIVVGDATTYPLPAEPLVVYMFNPFKQPLVDQVLRNIRQSLERFPRCMFLIYYNPVCKEDVERAGFLKRRFSQERYGIEVYEAAMSPAAA